MSANEVIVVAPDAAFRHSLVFVLESGAFRVSPFAGINEAFASTGPDGFLCAVVDEDAVDDWAYARAQFERFGRPVVLLVGSHLKFAVGPEKLVAKPLLGEALLQAVHEAATTT